MKIDCLVAEIGSTTTVVNAFNIHNGPAEFLGRGMHATTVDSDVNIGLNNAIEDLKVNLNIEELTYDELFASSSAAGGLKITVHGLVYEMTAKAAKQAALNAGANIHLITANRLEEDQIQLIKSIKPNIIIIAGGTDFGEKEVAFSNLLKVIPLNIPIIYAGNPSNHHRIEKLNSPLIKIVENVYPRVDDFNIMPLRKVIYQTFEENIIHAKGMKDIFKKVNQSIIPTPGAVMDATLLLYDIIDGVITIDVGGATTDVHSVCQISPAYLKYSDGEPLFKRTVEGDLGVFLNRNLVVQQFKPQELEFKTGFKGDYIKSLILKEPFIPETTDGQVLIEAITEKCVHLALDRHIGDLKRVFTTNGVKVIPEGKDLTLAKAIFLTGGALIYSTDPKLMVKNYLEKQHTKLVPNSSIPVYVDFEYIFASIGVLSHKYPEQAKQLLKQTLRWEF
jgi:uncharacterized protein (TIGR01319 family)